jgi:hypothetical protein
MKAALAALLLAGTLIGCGGDGVFIISFNSGIIAGDPACRNNGGQFDLRNQGGLVLLVILNNNSTVILANGSRGACRDLSANAAVQVRGPQDGNRITAQSVTLE